MARGVAGREEHRCRERTDRSFLLGGEVKELEGEAEIRFRVS